MGDLFNREGYLAGTMTEYMFPYGLERKNWKVFRAEDGGSKNTNDTIADLMRISNRKRLFPTGADRMIRL